MISLEVLRSPVNPHYTTDIRIEAADEIERLREENFQLIKDPFNVQHSPTPPTTDQDS